MSSERPAGPSLMEVSTRSQTPPRQSTPRAAINQADGQGRQGGIGTGHQGQLDASSHKDQEGLLPAFSTKHYSQLPTPQSPSDSNRFPAAIRFPPESPVPQSQAYTAPVSFPQRLPYRSAQEEALSTTDASHILTPASSPFNPRNSSSRNDNPATPSNQSPRALNSSRPFSIDSMLNTPMTPKNNHIQLAASSLETAEQSVTHPTLSSPFTAKTTVSRTPSRQSRGDELLTGHVASSQPPHTSSSQTSSSTSDVLMRPPGGEMERIRQARRESQLSQLQLAESRRPEYLKRAKRTIDECDPDAMNEDSRERSGTVGIMESPNKGRRLALFQETSEESFEESLMAGGYGRYRTADWVRQPQPISLPLGGAALPVPAPVVTPSEEPKGESRPLTEKEVKKQQRLAAFKSNRSEGRMKAKLYPVELEGKGRVLLDIPNELPQVIGDEAGSSTKKRGSRKKKKGSNLASMDNKAFADAAAVLVAEDWMEKPNWPDAEFPWRLRMEEREEAAKAEEEERLKWIEKFLDRDSDEDEPDGPPTSSAADADSDGEVLPSNQWGMVYENDAERPAPYRMGRGKMVPLLAHPEDPRKAHRIKRTAFPSDPGDAKAALLAKRSVRALSYRKERRERELRDEESDDEELCICGGVDDGRPLVQCDGCQTWYHLWCLGIRFANELGREEDPWYCRRCLDSRSRSPSSEPEIVPDFAPVREPTFAPTDNAPHERSFDPFFQPSVVDSPYWLRNGPKTPTRITGFLAHDNWMSSPSDPVMGPPSTPESLDHPVRIYTPGKFDVSLSSFEESPFDPASTPSRGIRFSASFVTPKSQVWPRPTYGLQTPLRGDKRSNRGSIGGAGSLSATLDENGARPFSVNNDPYNMTFLTDESPIRRSDTSQTRRPLGSPISSRLLDESPVMRTKGKERKVF